MLHALRKAAPGKKFFPATTRADCPNMRLNTIEKMVWALEDMENIVTVPEDVRVPALRSIERMLSIS